MKLLCLVALALACASAKPIFASDSLQVTPTEVQQWINAFAQGMKIDTYTNSSAECSAQFQEIFQMSSVAINQFNQGNTYIGLLNLTTALGYCSPLSRQCTNVIDELGVAWSSYVNQFTSFSDFTTKVEVNFMGNFYQIKTIASKIGAEYILNKNMTLISELTGELMYTIFHITGMPPSAKPLTYTETNPLAANPMKDWIWVPLEATFHFLTESKFVSESPLALCESSNANFVLDIFAGIGYEKNGELRNMMYAFSDALTYTHGIVEGCHDTGAEIGATWGQVNTQVFKAGKFWSNFASSLVGIFLVDGPWLTAEIFYSDFISMFGALGNVFYRVLVKDLTPVA